MKANTESNGISPESIARRAYEMWESEGRPDGRDYDHWLQAEAMLRGSSSGTPSSNTTSRGRKPGAMSGNGRREKNLEMVS
ncbi:MAG TPA: DUF2934 domain-containing protein [Candidatus Acidoferrum sp.]|nr:DUF2934 domain-containing protein [Candidatus Acidoferrum sp.]